MGQIAIAASVGYAFCRSGLAGVNGTAALDIIEVRRAVCDAAGMTAEIWGALDTCARELAVLLQAIRLSRRDASMIGQAASAFANRLSALEIISLGVALAEAEVGLWIGEVVVAHRRHPDLVFATGIVRRIKWPKGYAD